MRHLLCIFSVLWLLPLQILGQSFDRVQAILRCCVKIVQIPESPGNDSVNKIIKVRNKCGGGVITRGSIVTVVTDSGSVRRWRRTIRQRHVSNDQDVEEVIKDSGEDDDGGRVRDNV